MRLKRLICRGFKSFADRTEFEFDSNLTGIIGPNGCGKSNVVDALKWVLGDQRARSLRGKEMTDVIFKGAEGRDGMHQAEVTIVLENEGAGDDGRQEITVGRRLNQDKESDYLLNGSPVRLRDIRDALMDTGLGVGAYSVMEQGRIDAVLSANPEDRRAIFEEAAGISRFKLQKKEALRKLDRTEQNLARVKDLLEERGTRIRSLKIQAGKARRYREIRGQLRDLKAAVAVVEADAQRRQRHELAASLETAQTQLREIEQRRDTAAERARGFETVLAEAAAAIETLQGELHRVQSERDAGEHRAQVLEHRAEELEADVRSCGDRVQQLEAQRTERAATLAAERARLVELEARLVTLGGELETRREEVKARQRDVKRLQEAREVVRADVLDGIHRRTRIRNEIHEQEAQIRAARARGTRVRARLAELRGELERVRAENDRLEVVAAHLARQRAELVRQEEAALRELAAADERAGQLAREESQLRQRLSAVLGSLEVLQDMEAHYEGLDQGPRFLLEERAPGVRGRLLELLDVEVDHGAALEVALGPFVQALVVDTRANAQAMLARLAREGRGRALLLVEEAFRADTQPPRTDLPAGGVPLARLVRCPQAARGLVDWLLRDVVLVPALEAVADWRRDLCYVTRDGELAWGPRLEGGRSEGQGGMVVRRAQIQRLEQERADLERSLDSLSTGVSAAAERVGALKAQARRLAQAAAAVRVHEQETIAQKSRLEGRAKELAREREQLELEAREAHQHRIAAVAALGARLFDVALLDRLERRRAAAEEAASAELESAQSTLQALAQGEQELRVEHVAATTDRQALASAIKMHEQAVRDLQVGVEDLQRRAQEAGAGVEKARRDATEFREAGRVLDERRRDLETRRGQAQAEQLARQQERAQVQQELAAVENDRTTVGEQIAERRLQLSECDHRFARLEERLREDTGVELRRCLGEVVGLGLVSLDLALPAPPPGLVEQLLGPPLPPDLVAAECGLERLWEAADFDADAARKKAQVMQAQVDRLGHVNLDAERELAQMEESFLFLEKEVGDLQESRKHLMETLRRLEQESRALFEATFNAARENFQTIFRKLFQGGRAEMTLTEGEDALEAGIEIVARPPGKQLQSINLLSGGERSLTALAILFAVFKVKPSPFCILDEVDAALDDTNVERFLRVLREFVGPTQFCIVTHHKRTMADCQVLYGITMQRRGVSSRIAVSLDEAEEFTQTGAAGEEATNGGLDRARSRLIDPALKQRIAGEEHVGF